MTNSIPEHIKCSDIAPHTTVPARITRKPNGEVLTMRVLFGPDDIDIPKGDEARYQVKQNEEGTITLTLEGVS